MKINEIWKLNTKLSWVQVQCSALDIHSLNTVLTEGKACTQRCKKKREQKVPNTEMILGL